MAPPAEPTPAAAAEEKTKQADDAGAVSIGILIVAFDARSQMVCCGQGSRTPATPVQSEFRPRTTHPERVAWP